MYLSIFQGFMNSIFRPALRKFLLVFCDEVQHVDKVLKLLEEQQPYVKPSKCFFGVKEVEYLGHEGVKVGPNKIKAMME